MVCVCVCTRAHACVLYYVFYFYVSEGFLNFILMKERGNKIKLHLHSQNLIFKKEDKGLPWWHSG